MFYSSIRKLERYGLSMFECYVLFMGTAVGKRESLHDGFEIIVLMLFTVVVVSSVLVTQDMLQGAQNAPAPQSVKSY